MTRANGGIQMNRAFAVVFAALFLSVLRLFSPVQAR